MNYLLLHWRHRQHRYNLMSLMLSVFRSSRILLFCRQHSRLCHLNIYREYITRSAGHDLFHHLSHRYYLANHLSMRQRVRIVLSHYSFENTTFNNAYKQAVYLEQGIALWATNVNDINFCLQLSAGDRTVTEGDLCIDLLVNQKSLHRINFAWIRGDIFKLESPIVPFIGRTQGYGRIDPETRQQFDDAFPQNSPIFFCFSALQGMAQAIGATTIIGVSSEHQVGFDHIKTPHFSNTYDTFWESLGGAKEPASGYLIPVPFHIKPLSEVSAKHRKRATERRKYWHKIDNAARTVLEAYLVPDTEFQAKYALSA